MTPLRLTLALVLVGFAASAAPSLTVSVERKEVAVRSPFLIRIVAEGTKVGDVHMPDLPDGLRISEQPTGLFTNVVTINGVQSQSIQAQYEAVATRVGKISIPPLSAEIDGTTVHSQPVELNVTPSLTPSAGGGEDNTNPQLTIQDVAFVTTEVDTQEAFQGQPLRLTLSLWQIDMPEVKVDRYSQGELEGPQAEGFYITPRVPEVVGEERLTRNGHTYRVSRYRQVLYPMQSGNLKVDAWKWDGRLQLQMAMRGVQYHDLTLQSDPIEIHVKPLPKPQPDGFSGAVGDFEFRGAMLAGAVPLGVPVQMVVRVVGAGNPDAIGEPVVPLVDGLRISKPTREVSPIRDPNTIAVEKTFAYTVRAVKLGNYTIPEVRFVYFNPLKAEYETKSVGPFELEVKPPSENTARVSVDASNAHLQTSEGLRPVVKDPGPLHPRGTLVLPIATLFVLPPLCYVALALFVARKRRFENDPHYARSYHALGKGLVRLESVPHAPEPAEQLYHAVTGFIADKYGVPEGGITSRDADELLQAHGVNGEVAAGFARILRVCERARYGGESLSAEETEALILAAHTTMERLEREEKGARLS